MHPPTLGLRLSLRDRGRAIPQDHIPGALVKDAGHEATLRVPQLEAGFIDDDFHRPEVDHVIVTETREWLQGDQADSRHVHLNFTSLFDVPADTHPHSAEGQVELDTGILLHILTSSLSPTEIIQPLDYSRNERV
jgi:hypothetical protein